MSSARLHCDRERFAVLSRLEADAGHDLEIGFAHHETGHNNPIDFAKFSGSIAMKRHPHKSSQVSDACHAGHEAIWNKYRLDRNAPIGNAIPRHESFPLLSGASQPEWNGTYDASVTSARDFFSDSTGGEPMVNQPFPLSMAFSLEGVSQFRTERASRIAGHDEAHHDAPFFGLPADGRHLGPTDKACDRAREHDVDATDEDTLNGDWFRKGRLVFAIGGHSSFSCSDCQDLIGCRVYATCSRRVRSAEASARMAAAEALLPGLADPEPSKWP